MRRHEQQVRFGNIRTGGDIIDGRNTHLVRAGRVDIDDGTKGRAGTDQDLLVAGNGDEIFCQYEASQFVYLACRGSERTPDRSDPVELADARLNSVTRRILRAGRHDRVAVPLEVRLTDLAELVQRNVD